MILQMGFMKHFWQQKSPGMHQEIYDFAINTWFDCGYRDKIGIFGSHGIEINAYGVRFKDLMIGDGIYMRSGNNLYTRVYKDGKFICGHGTWKDVFDAQWPEFVSAYYDCKQALKQECDKTAEERARRIEDSKIDDCRKLNEYYGRN